MCWNYFAGKLNSFCIQSEIILMMLELCFQIWILHNYIPVSITKD